MIALLCHAVQNHELKAHNLLCARFPVAPRVPLPCFSRYRSGTVAEVPVDRPVPDPRRCSALKDSEISFARPEHWLNAIVLRRKAPFLRHRVLSSGHVRSLVVDATIVCEKLTVRLFHQRQLAFKPLQIYRGSTAASLNYTKTLSEAWCSHVVPSAVLPARQRRVTPTPSRSWIDGSSVATDSLYLPREGTKQIDVCFTKNM